MPIGQRMPIFERGQKAHWTESDYDVRRVRRGLRRLLRPAQITRVPRPGTLLEKQMLAATPRTSSRVTGSRWRRRFRTGRTRSCCSGACRPAARRSIRWRNTTRPTAISAGAPARPGSPMSAAGRSTGNFTDVYEQHRARVRERGIDDFESLHQEDRPADASQMVAGRAERSALQEHRRPADAVRRRAIAETAMRLWNSDFLPQENARAGSRPSCRKCSSRAIRPPS